MFLITLLLAIAVVQAALFTEAEKSQFTDYEGILKVVNSVRFKSPLFPGENGFRPTPDF
jgi:hypothetical protein